MTPELTGQTTHTHTHTQTNTPMAETERHSMPLDWALPMVVVVMDQCVWLHIHNSTCTRLTNVVYSTSRSCFFFSFLLHFVSKKTTVILTTWRMQISRSVATTTHRKKSAYEPKRLGDWDFWNTWHALHLIRFQKWQVYHDTHTTPINTTSCLQRSIAKQDETV
jgi:hypothetical protein